MPEPVLHFCGPASQFNAQSHEGVLRAAGLAGQLTLQGAGSVELSYNLAISDPFAISHFRARLEGAMWRRSAGMIRADAFDHYFVRLVQRGRLNITTSMGTVQAASGHFSISRTNVPYFAELMPDEGCEQEAYHALVPGHMIAARMPPHANLSLSIGTGSGAGRVAAELLKILYDQGEALALAGRAAMAEAFVIALVQAIGETSDAHMPATRKSRRVNEILRVIEVHAPNPALSVGDVAMKCGISRRHLSDLLRREGLAFSRYLQDRRLKIAEDMLLSPAMRDQSIGEIAQMAGFASAQYFCRIFKASKGQTPGAFRQSESGLSAVSA